MWGGLYCLMVLQLGSLNGFRIVFIEVALYVIVKPYIKIGKMAILKKIIKMLRILLLRSVKLMLGVSRDIIGTLYYKLACWNFVSDSLLLSKHKLNYQLE